MEWSEEVDKVKYNDVGRKKCDSAGVLMDATDSETVQNKENGTGSLQVTKTNESNNAFAKSGVKAVEGGSTYTEEDKVLDDLHVSLHDQEIIFDGEKKGIESTKEEAKEKVNNYFEKINEFLSEKKEELLHKIDTSCDVAIGKLTDMLNHVKCDTQKVENCPRNCEGSEAKIEELKNEIDTRFESRVNIFNLFELPKLVLNEKSEEIVKGLCFGEFPSIYFADEEEADLETQGNDSDDSDTYESAPESEDFLDDDENGKNNDMIIDDGTENVESEVKDNKHNTEGTTAVLGNDAATPKASRVKVEECVTPYWKAMGLSKPPEVPQPPGQAEDEDLPDNNLQHLHSFSLYKMHDQKKIVPVALTWNRGRICVADRANNKVGFYNPSGELITEMFLDCTELRDLTFLDESFGETRYVLTSPRSKTLMIIGIDAENTTRVIHKMDSPHRYSFICRGPRPGALLGAKVVSKSNKSIVHMFTMAGQILTSIANTPSYNQLQCVKGVDVYGSNIIVLDGNINSVSVYQDDGRTIGEYRGTPESPLVRPADMSLDNKGNIMVLNGDSANIHVIDLQCNLIEIIKIPGGTPSKSSSRKLIAFDIEDQKLAIAKSNGDIAIYRFKNGYSCLTQRTPDPCLALPHQNVTSVFEPPQEIVPLVEGMVPSTIEDIMSKQRGRNRLGNRQYPS